MQGGQEPQKYNNTRKDPIKQQNDMQVMQNKQNIT